MDSEYRYYCTMKISIITPVYNSVKTVEKTILSVINQKINSELELEYIVIDGGSSDGTQQVIQRYREQISLFISERDKGVYDAMNKGIAHATGDIIGIINSDDWYNDGALSIVESKFEEKPELEVLYSPVDTYFNDKYLVKFIPGSLENLPFKFTINHPSCFVRKSVYDRIGDFNLDYSIAADYDFIFRAYNANINFDFVENSLASYSLNGMSGKPLAKFKQIQQSWIVGLENIPASEKYLKNKRKWFYLNWALKEILVFPLKPLLNPHLSRRVKGTFRQIMGGVFPSDKYGAW